MSPKGEYGRGGLPISSKYVYPRPRNPLLLAGLAAGLALALLVWGVWAFKGSAAVVAGPVSSAHANFANDCESCHLKGGAVANEKCAACHEEAADPIGLYSYASHYVYRSGDYRRAHTHDGERSCGSCHREHRGRTASLTRVPDSECIGCHGPTPTQARAPHPVITGFDLRHHPEFAAIGKPDDASLRFTHDFHVREIAKEEKLHSSEDACLYCHNPAPGGASFLPLSFDRHCQPCHLKRSSTEWVPLTASLDAPVPAAVSPREIAAHGGPGTAWARGGAQDYEESGGRIRKRMLVHRDPWVLFNLRRLRSTLYGSGRIADLLVASPDVPSDGATALYAEALRTLRAQADEMRHDPALRKDLEVVERRMDDVERRLRNPATSLPVEPFAIESRVRKPMGAEEAARFDSVTVWLTRECQTCHQVEHETIVRVASDQRTFLRARFDHREHLVQRRCLDCHQRIPIRPIADTHPPAPSSKDMAAIQNLPGRSTCITCHAPGKAEATCVSCHDFHPRKTRPSEVPLALE